MSSYFTWLANDKHRLYWCSTRCSGTERLELHLISIDYNMTRDQNSIFRVGRVQWLDWDVERDDRERDRRTADTIVIRIFVDERIVVLHEEGAEGMMLKFK